MPPVSAISGTSGPLVVFEQGARNALGGRGGAGEGDARDARILHQRLPHLRARRREHQRIARHAGA
jgi:hypothetical protein